MSGVLDLMRLLVLLLDRALWSLPSGLTFLVRRRRLRASVPALVLLAKYPSPGRSKTRLAASGLGEAYAAEVARAMLVDLLARHSRSTVHVQRVLLFAPPDSAHRELFSELLAEAGAEGAWTLMPMSSSDLRSSNLSAILADALGRVRARFAPVSTVVFIGADAPTVGVDAVRAAVASGVEGRAHLCPAEDGGYTLLGVPAGAPPSVFAGVRWSVPTTAISQSAKLAAAGVPVEVGSTFADVDDAEGFERLRDVLAADSGQCSQCARVWALMERGPARGGEAGMAEDASAGGGDGAADGHSDAAAAEAVSDAATVAAAAQQGDLARVSGEAFGIGGLDEALQTIARRVLATRTLSPALVERLGLRHTRGLLLHGPPGTGKTLAARTLGRLLGISDSRVRLVAGPELFNQYVGRSESNMRELFAEAEREQKEYHDDQAEHAGFKGGSAGGGDGRRAFVKPPHLHMIIFDEIDTLSARRQDTDTGSGASVTGSLVLSQLLSKLDGLSPLNNIFVAGTTNRLDAIDEALLRPGRLELQLEIGLPAEPARVQILRIHTAPLRREGRLALDEAGLAELAAAAPNYTGAELEASVRAAISRAVVGARGKAGWTVGRAELEQGLADVRPAFGDADGREALLRLRMRGGESADEVPEADPRVRALCDAVRKMASGELGGGSFAVLVRGAGSEALSRARARAAVAAALAANAPLLRVLGAEEHRLLGKRPLERAEAISRAVREAHRSQMSCVVLDGIDRLASAHVVRDLHVEGSALAKEVRRVDFDRELLASVIGALTARPREQEHVCVLVCTCASDDVCDALFRQGDGEEPLFSVVCDVR
ncbi:hypothetical protein T492DRAFT_1049610 [Pavlovales sp. CCMP2436]|nr:hypothetical protein T492DRAFT_1049610 [Pavlovales sp. CCMP2436]